MEFNRVGLPIRQNPDQPPSLYVRPGHLLGQQRHSCSGNGELVLDHRIAARDSTLTSSRGRASRLLALPEGAPGRTVARCGGRRESQVWSRAFGGYSAKSP
jgi:hypothetical protein